MVHIVPNMLQSQVAVVIIGVHVLGHRLVELRVKETKDVSSHIWSLSGKSEKIFNSYLMKHENDKGLVDNSQLDYHSLVPLEGLEDLFKVRVEITESYHEYASCSETSDRVCSLH